MRIAIMFVIVVGVLMGTAFDVYLQAARNLEALFENVASAHGTEGTLIDEELARQGARDDEYNAGTIFVSTSSADPAISGEQVGLILEGEQVITGTLAYLPEPGSVKFHVPVYTSSPPQDYITLEDTAEDGVLVSNPQSGTTPRDMSSTPVNLGSMPVLPGSFVAVKNDVTLLTDNGEGKIIDSIGREWGTIDYEIGQIVRNVGFTGVGVVQTTFTTGDWVGHVSYTTGAFRLYTNYNLDTDPVFAEYNRRLFLPFIAVITDYSTGTNTLSYAAQRMETRAGDRYGVMHNRYPIAILRQKLNEFLHEIMTLDEVLTDGQTPTYWPTSLMVNGQLAWTDQRDIRTIEIGNDSATNPQWAKVTRWTLSAGTLFFPDLTAQSSSDTMLRITVEDRYTGITDDLAELNSRYPVAWLALETALKCARWRLYQAGADERQITTMINDLMSRRDRERARIKHVTRPLISYQSSHEWPEY